MTDPRYIIAPICWLSEYPTPSTPSVMVHQWLNAIAVFFVPAYVRKKDVSLQKLRVVFPFLPLQFDALILNKFIAVVFQS